MWQWIVKWTGGEEEGTHQTSMTCKPQSGKSEDQTCVANDCPKRNDKHWQMSVQPEAEQRQASRDLGYWSLESD